MSKLSFLVATCAVFASAVAAQPASASNCHEGPVPREWSLPRGTVELNMPRREIDSAFDKVEIRWRARNLAAYRLRWYKGCLRGSWSRGGANFSVFPRAAATQSVRFSDTHAPAGRIHVWAEMEDWPTEEGYEVMPVFAYLGTINVTRKLNRLEGESLIEFSDLSDDRPREIYSLASFYTQRRLRIRSSISISVCRRDECSEFRSADRSQAVRARSYSTLEPYGEGRARWNTSYESRWTRGATLRLSEADILSLCDAIDSGATIRARSQSTLWRPRSRKPIKKLAAKLKVGKESLWNGDGC